MPNVFRVISGTFTSNSQVYIAAGMWRDAAKFEAIKELVAEAVEHDKAHFARMKLEAIADAAAAALHMLSLQNPASVYIVSDSTPLPTRALYEALAQSVGGPCPPVGPAPAMVGSKRLSNARLVATGFKFKWPDSRDGYAAAIATPDS
jgi:hypothetical protein